MQTGVGSVDRKIWLEPFQALCHILRGGLYFGFGTRLGDERHLETHWVIILCHHIVQ
jgi:hypothetical protein